MVENSCEVLWLPSMCLTLNFRCHLSNEVFSLLHNFTVGKMKKKKSLGYFLLYQRFCIQLQTHSEASLNCIALDSCKF